MTSSGWKGLGLQSYGGDVNKALELLWTSIIQDLSRLQRRGCWIIAETGKA